MHVTEVDFFNSKRLIHACSDVHLWLIKLNQEDGDWRDFDSLLSSDEKQKSSTFVISKPAYAYAKNRTLLRMILSQYLSIDKKQLCFDYGEEGKPCLSKKHGSKITFNVSHTSGLMVLAIGSENALGVDCERLDRASRYLDLAKREFSSDEYAWLLQANDNDLAKQFWRLWVAKEACLKMGGQGLTLGLDTYLFANDPQGVLRLQAVSPSLLAKSSNGMQNEGWEGCFHELYLLPESYCMALAGSSAINSILYQIVDDVDVFSHMQ